MCDIFFLTDIPFSLNWTDVTNHISLSIANYIFSFFKITLKDGVVIVRYIYFLHFLTLIKGMKV